LQLGITRKKFSKGGSIMTKVHLTLGFAALVASQAFLLPADAYAQPASKSEHHAAKAGGSSPFVIETIDGSVRLDATALQGFADPNHGRGTPAPTLSVNGNFGNLPYSLVPGTPGVGNSNFQLPIGIGNSVIGIGWEVTIEAFTPSWRSEARVAIVTTQSVNSGLFLRPLSASTFNSPGVSTATSNGVLLFADVTPTPIPPILADGTGNIYFEFHETFDDTTINPDSEWFDSATPTTLPPGLRLICSDQAACDAAVGGGPPAELVLETTVALDNGMPAQCGATDTVSASVGEQVNICYVVTNNTAESLDFHTLDDSIDGNIFTDFPQVLAPGANFQFNRLVTAVADAVHVGTWTGATELPGYSSDDSLPSGFIDISATGTNLGLTDDSTAGVTLPFSFDFFGNTSDQICVSNNGGIIVGATTCSLSFSNTALPAAAIGPAIFPFWDDMDDETGGVFWQVQGTAPNRVAIVQWHQRPHFTSPQPPTPDTATFQVQIFEDTNAITFEYLDVDFANPLWNGGISATIGMQSANGVIANQYSFNTASVASGDAILWTPTAPITFQASDSVTLDVGAPVITVDPSQIDAQADPGETTTVNLAIGNDGDRDLDWSVDETERGPRGHFPSSPRAVAHKNDVGQTALADPASTEMLAKQDARGGSPILGTPAVPAYSTAGFGTIAYVTLDALSPGTLTTIVAPPPTNIFAGEFINNDLTQQFFIASGGGTVPVNTYGYINTTTGAVTALGLVTGGPAAPTWTSLAWEASTGTLYASANSTASGNQLYTVNPVTGVATLVGPIAGPGLSPTPIVIAIAISPAGQLYGVEISNDVLIAIDKTSGAAALLGPTGVAANFAQDMDFDDSTGTLYWASYLGGGNSRMQTLDLITGDATEVGVIGGTAELLSFAIAIPSGGCAAPQDIPWLSVAPSSGTVATGEPDDIAVVTLDATGLTEDFYRATLCVSSNDPATPLVEVPVEFTVGNPPAEAADLGINLTDIPDPVIAGAELEFIATVVNFGPRAVGDATVEITLPAALDYVSGGLVRGAGTWSCAAAGQVVTCELVGGTLPPGGFAADLQISTTVDANAVPGTVDTLASVASTTWPDPNAGNDVDSETTTILADPDVIFRNGFDCADGLPGCDGGTPGVYTDRTTFLQNVSPGFYEENFASVPGGAAGPSLSFSGNGFAFTITAEGAGTNNLFNDPGVISTDSAVDAIVVTFTGAPVTAVGGNFWATDISVVPTGTDIVITLSNGTIETFTSTGPTNFRGFVTAAPITSIRIDAPDVPANAWSTMDNVILGD
jgi:hypothetical protein